MIFQSKIIRIIFLFKTIKQKLHLIGMQKFSDIVRITKLRSFQLSESQTLFINS